MKITKALLLAAATIVASACSDDDDDKKSSLESAKFSLANKSTVVTAPAGLQNSDDEHAMQANAWIQMANGMTQYFGFFEFPEGAAKSGSRITASNARVKEAGDVLVYTWEDEQSGMSVAYQVSETSDRFVWEIFTKETGENWLKVVHAEEKKDQSAGSFKVFDTEGEDPSKVVLAYEWSTSGDIFTVEFNDGTDQNSWTVEVNTKTGAGSVVAVVDGAKMYEMTWDAAGNGTWAFYEDGEVSDSGTWEA
ncbi:hypothetical protein [Pseudochryseolinea flava]|uniref:Lipoprotein n=1 Tax=Pseudochryseolinea flava TaxID=2059302 RepID=A0A364Y1N3_9BACT|nr:hypothetical protein [Pseudochryseolinea flava]RAW00540.1 hypothetical protein DQQ10_13150 [Pseudochryseolinea flava]